MYWGDIMIVCVHLSHCSLFPRELAQNIIWFIVYFDCAHEKEVVLHHNLYLVWIVRGVQQIYLSPWITASIPASLIPWLFQVIWAPRRHVISEKWADIMMTSRQVGIGVPRGIECLKIWKWLEQQRLRALKCTAQIAICWAAHFTHLVGITKFCLFMSGDYGIIHKTTDNKHSILLVWVSGFSCVHYCI